MIRLAIPAALLLAACTAPEPPEVKVARLMGDWRNQCIAAGYTAPEQQNACVTILADAYADEQSTLQARQAAMGAMGVTLLQQSQQPARRPMTTCTTQGVFTNCW
jgi:hypothetical protein